MDVEIPEDCSEEELEQIQKVLEESIANSLGCNPDDVDVKIDPETGEATYVISTDDPTLAEKTQKALKSDDFAQNVNKAIAENSENLPERIREVLEIKDVNPDEEITTEARDVNHVFFFPKTNKKNEIQLFSFEFLSSFQNSNKEKVCSIIFHKVKSKFN